MLDYKKILFPIDLSETSVKIFPHVETVADKFGAEIILIFVAKVHEYYVEDEKEPGESIRKKVKSYRDKHFPTIPENRVVIKDGEAADEILSYIESAGIDMVIMATRGRKALDKAIFGSVAANVARSAPVPVFFVNPFTDKFLKAK
ncbi:MAG: universal stress protein [Desulfobacterales bacterium]